MSSLYRWSSTLFANYAGRHHLRSSFVGRIHQPSNTRQISFLNRMLEGPDSDALAKINSVPFYELHNTPFPIRLTWLLLFMDAFFTATGTVLAWKYWTYEVPSQEEGAPPKHELRPTNHRLALAALHIGVGSVVALKLLTQRRTQVRKLWLFPASVPGSYRKAKVLPALDTIVVENYSWFNPRLQFTLDRNAYRFARQKEDAVLHVMPGTPQADGFGLITEGVLIDGKFATKEEALREILDPYGQVKQVSTSSKTKEQSKTKQKKMTANTLTAR